MEFSHHRNFKMAAGPVIAIQIFEDLIQPLSEKSPKAIQWTILQDLVRDMNGPVMVGFHVLSPVKLHIINI